MTKYQTAFSKITGKVSLKCKKGNNGQQRSWKRKKIKRKPKKKVSCKSNLKKWFKTNNFPHLIAKTRFHIRYFSEDKKCPILLSAIFSNTKKLVARKYYQNWKVMNYFVYIPNVKKICQKDFVWEKHWMEGC